LIEVLCFVFSACGSNKSSAREEKQQVTENTHNEDIMSSDFASNESFDKSDDNRSTEVELPAQKQFVDRSYKLFYGKWEITEIVGEHSRFGAY